MAEMSVFLGNAALSVFSTIGAVRTNERVEFRGLRVHI